MNNPLPHGRTPRCLEVSVKGSAGKAKSIFSGGPSKLLMLQLGQSGPRQQRDVVVGR